MLINASNLPPRYVVPQNTESRINTDEQITLKFWLPLDHSLSYLGVYPNFPLVLGSAKIIMNSGLIVVLLDNFQFCKACTISRIEFKLVSVKCIESYIPRIIVRSTCKYISLIEISCAEDAQNFTRVSKILFMKLGKKHTTQFVTRETKHNY